MSGRRCPFGVGLCLLVVLMQVLAAPAHASLMASHGEGGLNYVLCGAASPAQLAELRASLPEELQGELGQPPPSHWSCDLCSGLHASDVALPATPPPIPVVTGRHEPPPVLAAEAAPRCCRHLPRQRGPPSSPQTV